MRKTLLRIFSLTPKVDKMIDDIVKQEEYMSRSELIRDLVIIKHKQISESTKQVKKA